MRPNYTFSATVKRVLDGDTIEASIELWRGLQLTVPIRLAHINAPEIHSTDPGEKKRGELSKFALQQKLGASGGTDGVRYSYDITLRIIKQEKFGRWLAEVFLEDERRRDSPDESINDWMVKQGHAVPYEGGKRSTECNTGNPFETEPEA